MKSFLLLLVVNYGACFFIIPGEWPSLLMVALSNIPPIKKGTDSRIGFGYAFGDHADFQVVLELGPQTNTDPIGQAFPMNIKRQTAKSGNIDKKREKIGSEPSQPWSRGGVHSNSKASSRGSGQGPMKPTISSMNKAAAYARRRGSPASYSTGRSGSERDLSAKPRKVTTPRTLHDAPTRPAVQTPVV